MFNKLSSELCCEVRLHYGNQLGCFLDGAIHILCLSQHADRQCLSSCMLFSSLHAQMRMVVQITGILCTGRQG